MSEDDLSITPSEQARINQVDQMDGRDAIPSSMVAEHGSIAGAVTALTENIRVQYEEITSQTSDAIDPATAIKTIYESINEFMNIEVRSIEFIKTLMPRNTQPIQSVLNASAVKEILEHVSGSSNNKEWVADVSTHKAIQSLLVFNNERSTFMTWNEKMTNAFTRVHPGSHDLLK